MINALRGMKDMLGCEGELFRRVVGVCEEVARRYGYEFCETPKMEETPLFRRSVGESSDIVGKEMYEFTDKGGVSVCLRPEGTAGVVRAFIEAKYDRAGGVKKYYYFGSMFRYERPQRGRLREFHQFGVECFGESSVREDASVILMLAQILEKLGVSSNLKINSLGDKDCMPRYKEKLVNFVNARKDEFCEDCKRRLATNPIRILDCKNDHCQELLTGAPMITDNLNEECAAEFEQLKKILAAAGIKFEIDPKLVRGLDYYTKTAFEFVSDEIGAKAAVAGGGRYDGLVEALGGRATPGIGWAMGVERIMEILRAKETPAKRDGVYICALEPALLDKVYEIGSQIRKKRKTEIAYEAKAPGKHLNIADKKGAEIFLCLGSDEAAAGEIWYKNLATKEEKKIKFENLKDAL